MKLKHKLEKLDEGIYHLVIKDRYDLAMTFCRVQEFYESPIKAIRGKAFTISNFMRLYAKQFGDGCFTYPCDWGGFNVPSKAIIDCYYDRIDDINEYDDFIQEISDKIYEDIDPEHTFDGDKPPKYYLIGTVGDKGTIEHEISHALYYLNPSYRKIANSIIFDIDEQIYHKLENALTDLGYSASVMKDEIQAYVGNDYDILTHNLKKSEIKKLNIPHKKLKQLQNEYYKGKKY